MKKFFAAVVALILTAAIAVSFTACSKDAKVKIIDIDLSTEQYGIAVQKGDTEMLQAVNEIVAQLKGEGVEYEGKKVTFNDLYTAEMEASEKNELISIGTVKTKSTNRENELVVATNAYFAPFEYFAGESFGGIDMQVAKMLAVGMGKELVILNMDFNVVLEAVKNDKADIGLAGLTINDERKLTVDFSDPYYDTTQRIAVAADDTTFDECETEEDVVNVLKSLTGVKAGAAKAQTGYFYLIGNESFEFEGYPNIETKMYDSIGLAVQDLAAGTVKLVCGDKDTLSAAVKGVNR